MTVRVTLPAPEGLELTLVHSETASGARLQLRAGAGEVTLRLHPAEGRLLFSYGRLSFEDVPPERAAPFVEEVAAWLGLALHPAPRTDPPGPESPPARPLQAAWWVHLGHTQDPEGTAWDVYKLVLELELDEGCAEVFLHVTDAGRAHFVEKDTCYRRTLVEILEHTLSPPPPRQVCTTAAPRILRDEDGRTSSVSIEGVLEVHAPEGWRVIEQDEGPWLLTDPNERVCFELEHACFGAWPPDAELLADRLRTGLRETGRAHRATAVTAFTREGAAFAWTEFARDASDGPDHDPVPSRQGRVRWLVASNGAAQVMMTGHWRQDEASTAERAWDQVVGSIRLAGGATSR